VTVFIYGGGFEFGSSINPTYDGTKFAEDGGILVSLNYRLGNFGESAGAHSVGLLMSSSLA
jgi:para-nitrobenzyl esterase